MIMLLQCDTILQWFHIHIAIILYEPENYIIMNDFTSSFIPNVNKKKITSPMDHLQWMGAVRMRVQKTHENSTISQSISWLQSIN